jgi:hypothetical protein
MRLPLRSILFMVATFVACLVPFSYANADEEGRVPLAHVQFNSAGLDNSGPIQVEAVQNEQGLSQLNVSAFGSLRSLTQSQLAPMQGYVVNAIGVSYSRGYSNTGGRSLYVLLLQGFSSGAEVVAVVTVTEHGKIRVKVIKPLNR